MDNRNIMSLILTVFLLLLDLLCKAANGSLSSPQDAPYVSQQNPVLTSAVALTKTSVSPLVGDDYLASCPSGGLCSKLPSQCLTCELHHNCSYGRTHTYSCRARAGVNCLNEQGESTLNFSLSLRCRFCWQLEPSEYQCSPSSSCQTVACPRTRYNATCEALEHVHCLVFQKRLYCNWTGGYKWSTALALSVTLGGFGADRFYLGQWREGLGKLFSFGGLGVWTLIDVLLIAVGYVGPADGSLYI
ncbi:hypothetical protein DNTS_029710 [Danionella cerebrum]|uniref:TM2 domain-containing protein 3 n=1 Tax=Danionella cerebrum TaxID=2873325 RepID=A0A553RLJ0_9TELE|nr:hypothetical protein DNTS_029710 [Danionella translucida]